MKKKTHFISKECKTSHKNRRRMEYCWPRPYSDMRTWEKKGDAVPCSFMGLQRPQECHRMQRTISFPFYFIPFLNGRSSREITKTMPEPKRVAVENYPSQSWRASDILLRSSLISSIGAYGGWCKYGTSSTKLGKLNYIGPKAGSSSWLQRLIIKSARLWSFSR